MPPANDPTVPMNVVAGRKAGGAVVPAVLVAASIVTVLIVVVIAQLSPGDAAGIVPSGTVSAVPGSGSAGPPTGPPASSPVGSIPAKAGGPGTTTPRSNGSTRTTNSPASKSQSSPSPTGTGHYPAWRANHGYAAGDRASYAGHDYQCLQAHTSQVGWEPPNTPALWQPLT